MGHCTAQIDYFFMRTRKDPVVGTLMSATESFWGRRRAIKVETKGARPEYTVKWLVNFCRSLGVEKLYLRSDPENSCADIIAAVNEILPWIMPQYTAKGSKQSLGRAEGMHAILEGKSRTHLSS